MRLLPFMLFGCSWRSRSFESTTMCGVVCVLPRGLRWNEFGHLGPDGLQILRIHHFAAMRGRHDRDGVFSSSFDAFGCRESPDAYMFAWMGLATARCARCTRPDSVTRTDTSIDVTCTYVARCDAFPLFLSHGIVGDSARGDPLRR
jgi:hypothetical protein